MQNLLPPDAIEQLPITLFDGVVLAARAPDGLIHLALRDLCVTLSLTIAGQRRRIQANDQLHLTQLRVYDGQQFRVLDMLALDDVPLWILTLQTRKVRPEQRDRIAYIKDYLVSAVRAAFAQATGLPDAPSRVIEDLRELDRVDQALRDLADLTARQTTIEQSQDRARVAFRDILTQLHQLQARMVALEHATHQRISVEQRGTIYHAVQRWGAAVAAQRSTTTGAGIHSCWGLVRQRFGIATYTDLPAARYDEALQFIGAQYHGLTGHDLDAPEQGTLELDQ